jgi:hypothetical protein
MHSGAEDLRSSDLSFLTMVAHVYIVLPIHQTVDVGYHESWDAIEYWWLALPYTAVSEVSCVKSPH